MKPGTYVFHKAGGIHYDGAKDEPAVIQVWGTGPMTTTRPKSDDARAVRGAASSPPLAWLGASSAQSGAQSAPLRALSSNGVRAALEELVPQCERSAGQPDRARVRHVGVDPAAHRAAARPSTSRSSRRQVVAELAQGGHLVAQLDHAARPRRHRVGIRAGARRLEIGTADAIKQTLLDGEVGDVYAQDGASRPHIERMFERLGIAAEMKAKTLLEQGSVRAAEKVVAGEAEILLTLVSEILPVEGMELLGPLPAEFQSYITFDAAVGSRATDAAAARAFIACVAAPAAAPTFAAKGIER